jgi:hypothetical protein
MAHVLVAADDGPTCDLFRAVLEVEGHRVTTVCDGWQMLAALRSTLHPMVVVYWYFLLRQPLRDDRVPQPAQEELWQACLRNVEDLRAHRFIEWNPSDWAPGPDMQPLYDALGIVVLRMPLDLDELLALVGKPAQEPA